MAFERHIVKLPKCMSMQNVARHMALSRDVVKETVAKSLGRRFEKPKLRHLQQIAEEFRLFRKTLCTRGGHPRLVQVPVLDRPRRSDPQDQDAQDAAATGLRLSRHGALQARVYAIHEAKCELTGA